MNCALLGKLLWRLREDKDSLWKQVLVAKYGILRDGWDIQQPNYRTSRLWRGIVSCRDAFIANIKFTVGSGEKVLFWLDNWVGDKPLAEVFSDLFAVARDRKVTVSSYIIANDEEVNWGPTFRRNLTETEENNFSSLLDSLSQVSSNLNAVDYRIWTASKEGTFSISSFFTAISGGHSLINPLHRIWKLKIPPRVMVFSWLALRGGILTMDNLCRRRKIIVNAYPMCLADEESVDHLLLNCRVAKGLWFEVLSWFHCS